MNLKNPAWVSVTASVILAVVIFSVLFFSGISITVIHLIIITASAFFIFWFFIEKIIYARFRKFYELLRKSGNENTGEKNQLTSSDIVAMTEQEISRWVNERKDEIEKMKKLETHRREFLGNVSHELKTPIFNIQGYVSTLLDGGLQDASINIDYLRKAEKNVERLIRIVEELVDISQLETSELRIDKEPFDLIKVVREIIEAQDFNAQSKKIRMALIHDGLTDAFVNADKFRIRQMLTNLVVNSIYYGKENGETNIRISDNGKYYKVEIADTGIGIPQEHLPRIFERFYRVDKSRSRQQGGTGLGLSIVKHIIEAHGQSIQVKSKAGAGTVFTFLLEKN